MLTRTLGLLGIVGGLVLACAGSPPSTTMPRPTSAQLYASGSPELRTVDNTGHVDPGGRTREVSAGGTSTVGVGNGMVRPPYRESASGSGRIESSPSASGIAPAPSDPAELPDRAARALCDRETSCGRVGSGKAFESGDACLVAKRESVHRAIDGASCGEVHGDRIAQCLTAIR
ncbi:MAG: DUF6184 family natural product biosynthesis lipoprotein, partial [Polyangiaceae bacterium]